MKNLLIVAFLAIAVIALAQAFAPGAAYYAPATSTASCPLSDSPSAVAATCLVNTGIASTTGVYVTMDGGKTWQGPLSLPAGQAPVQSVFGRTGVVAAQQGDYNFSQVNGQITGKQMPSSQTCSFSDTVGATGGSITLSNCQ